jgi:transcriptional regulator with GAF, ATPase, and Fis domain
MDQRELGALRKLREFTELLAHESDPRRLVPLVLDQAIELVGAERGFVILASGTGPNARLDVAEARNLDHEEIQQPEFKVSRSIVQRVVKSGRAEVISDAESQQDTRDIPSVQSLHLRSVMVAPLRAHAQTLGAVYVDHRHVKRRFDASDLETLVALAAPAAIALDAARRNAELYQGQVELARRLETIERLRAEAAERYRERSRELDRIRDAAARRTTEAASPEGEVPGVIARAPSYRRLLALARKVAPSEASVLILGESGTGKEVIARVLHALSGRPGPFVAENCAALQDTLLESELFGHEPGAFTGAVKVHRGLFETARDGTLLLDEVGEMSAALQAKLLRVLQEREIRRLGGEERIPVSVRVLAATHRDLEAMVAQGRFRADLYYRLNVVRLEIPPLRARLEDVPALLDHFLADAGGGRIRIDPQARELLLSHGWPGNVRELENEVRRLVVLADDDGVIRPGLLSPSVLGRAAATPARAPIGGTDAADVPIEGIWRLDDLEREMLLRALRRARGNKTTAAKMLGLAKTSLYNRLEKHGLSAPSEEGPVQP